MTRKKVLILGSLLLTVISAGGGAAFFIWPEAISHLPFVGDKLAVAGDKPPDHAAEGDPEHVKDAHGQEKPAVVSGAHGEEKTAEAAEADHGELSQAEGGHGEDKKSGNGQEVELVAASDYVVPNSRTSGIVGAVRKMNSLQTRMAEGDRGAPQQLKDLMRRIPDLIDQVNTEKLPPSDVQAVALFVLSGGDPSVVSRLLKADSLTKKQKALLNGIVSYASADSVKAAEILLPLDPNTFETTLSAQLAVAQAQAATEAPVIENIARLAFAANTVPGTLIEEAAIRRLIPLLAGEGKSKKFFYWAKRYLRRFPKSLYQQDFDFSTTDGIIKLLASNHFSDEAGLADMLGVAGEARAAALTRSILLHVVLEGSAAKCQTIEKALAVPYDLGSEKLKAPATLIQICKAIDGRSDALAELKSIDPSNLDVDVKLHLTKALTLAGAIQKDIPPPNDGNIGPNQPLSIDEAFSPLFASVAQQMDASLSAIRRVDDDETGSSK